MSSELGKMALLVEKGEKISKQLVQQVLLKSPEHTSFVFLTYRVRGIAILIISPHAYRHNKNTKH